jgi:hypothetical protein
MVLTPERTRFALDSMIDQQVAQVGTTVDPSIVYNVSSSGISQQSSAQPTLNAAMMSRMMDLVQNDFMNRASFLNKWMDARRDYNKECGYPETGDITADKWQDYYERHSIAGRVVELMPSECWQITPNITEDEDPNNTTPFEQAFKDLAKSLRTTESLYDPEEEVVHPIWEYCKRADILSGIGRFGIVLLGFNDGLSLNQPVPGWQEPQAAHITWNEEALPFLHEQAALVGKQIRLVNGKLVLNALPNEKGKDDPSLDQKNIRKSKRTMDKKNAQSIRGTPPDEPTDGHQDGNDQAKKLPPEPTNVDPTAPNQMAFGNVRPQQGKYRDPTDTQATKDMQPMEDQQPVFGEFATKDEEQVADQTEGIKLLYLRVFPESLVQIVRYEQNMNSPRFGQPVLYRITLNDPTQQYTGVGLPLSQVEVHYSRVVHLADVGANAVSSEIFAASRMRPVLNHLIDLQKIYGACGEGYWKNAFATLVAETHPQLGGDVTIDSTALRSQMKAWRDSLDRVLAVTGVTWKTVVPGQVDPNSYVQNEMQAICVKLGCPMRVFMGNEIGQLASGQDAVAWAFRVRERRKNYLTPRVIVPLLDRLILVGVLPRPARYTIVWPEDQSLLPAEKAQIAGGLTGAMATYISGQCDQFMEPITYLTEVWGWNRKRAQSAIEATMEHITRQQQQQAMAGGPQAIDPTTGQPLQQDEMGQYLDPNTGEPLQTDEMGNPVMINPETGEPMPVQMQSPQEQQGPLGAEAQELQQQGAFGDEEGSQLEQEQGGVPEVPEQSEEMDGTEGAADQQVAEGEVDPDTGLPIDPQTGYLVDEESGYLIDKESGDVYDPQSGESIGNVFDEAEGEEQPNELEQDAEGQEDPQANPEDQEQEGTVRTGQDTSTGGAESETDPETRWPIDSATGRIVNPDTGYQLDPQSGEYFDLAGRRVGNINE